MILIKLQRILSEQYLTILTNQHKESWDQQDIEDIARIQNM